jgi:hypothetical protein
MAQITSMAIPAVLITVVP